MFAEMWDGDFACTRGVAGHAGAAGFWRTVPEHHELQLPDMIKAGAVSFEGS